jgi:thioredoxin reductase (NADPH)
MENTVKEVVIIGTGPSALTAAIYTTRDEIETVLYEKSIIGGLASTTDIIENYPGFPKGIGGMALTDNIKQQAERFGAKIEFGEVSALSDEGKFKTIVVDGKLVKAKAVLIASGSNYAKLNIPGESDFCGRGVHYCATCDGAFYRDKNVVVVGGGNAAFQEAIFLTRFAKHIDLLVRNRILASTILQRKVQEYIEAGKIKLQTGIELKEIKGSSGRVVAIRVTKKDRLIELTTDGIFIFIGLKPNTDFLISSGIKLDKTGFVKANKQLETSIPGVFASGDVRSGATMQVAAAVGDGAIAGIGICEYLFHKQYTL